MDAKFYKAFFTRCLLFVDPSFQTLAQLFFDASWKFVQAINAINIDSIDVRLKASSCCRFLVDLSLNNTKLLKHLSKLKIKAVLRRIVNTYELLRN